MQNSCKFISKYIYQTIGIVCLAYFILCNLASASELINNLYLKVGGGGTYYESFKERNGYKGSSLKTAPTYIIGIGYKFTDSFATDLSFEYSKIKYKAVNVTSSLKQKVHTMSAFLNGYYDFNFNRVFIPYIMAGFGIGRNDSTYLILDNTSSTAIHAPGTKIVNLIWKVGGGIKFNLSKKLQLGLAYAYVDLGITRTKDAHSLMKGGKQKVRGHQALLNLIYNFN